MRASGPRSQGVPPTLMRSADANTALARRLVESQCPQWANLPVVPVRSTGTANQLFRIGEDLVLRLPHTDAAVRALEKEHDWLPRLGRHLSLATPEPLYKGEPQAAYPNPWSVFHWLPGEDGWCEPVEDLDQAARDLAGFVSELRAVPCDNGPPPGTHNAHRGAPLADLDRRVRRAIAKCGSRIPAGRVTALWERALDQPAWAQDQWLHGDIQPGNLLLQRGRISAVIDFGLLGVGDPAVDVLPAWNLFDGAARRLFRDLLQVDTATWHRAQGWGLFQAVMALPFYWDTNPTMVHLAQRLVREILREPN